jgi:hypothetical protein
MKNILFMRGIEPRVLLTEVEGINLEVGDIVELVEGDVADILAKHVVTEIHYDVIWQSEMTVDMYMVELLKDCEE